MTYEGLRLKLLKVRRKLFAKKRQKKLKNTDFTIISNNCWGGMIYESYNLRKNTPTVGLYFYAEDYIKFLKNLKKNLNTKLTFINPSESKWKELFMSDKRSGTFPIGKINDIEIFFLHYKSAKEAKEKWERRCKRVNFENLIVKFNDQNMCTEQDVKEFFKLPFKNKIFFTVKNWNIDQKYYKVRQLFNRNYILASYEPFGKNKYINLEETFNNLSK